MEYFGWGKYGGIGRATRDIATGLSRRGVNVSVVVPLSIGQRRREYVDGVDVYGFPLSEYPFISGILRSIDADVYHSQDPTLGTLLGLKAYPDAVHLMTSQNPKTKTDWEKVNKYYPKRRLLYNRFIDPWVNRCVKELDQVYCQARYTVDKVKKIFSLDYTPRILPNPVKVPESLPQKSGEPLVLFLGRFDGEKNPEGFMQLAETFPDVSFIAAGASHDKELDARLRAKYFDTPNLILPGFLNGANKNQLLDDAWVLANTSVSECLPVSFLEAAAHGCSILSPHDPDGFSSRFGYHASNNGFTEGLSWLLNDENWKERGASGYSYVKKYHEEKKVIDRHLKEYKKLVI